MLKEGSPAPEFELPGLDETGSERLFTLGGLMAGGPLVLYFYPRDNTPGCTAESCAFRDVMAEISDHATLAGVSRDSLVSHARFKERHALLFPLLSDPGHRVHGLYGAWDRRAVRAVRTTVLIGADRTVLRLWRNVRVAGHAREVIAALSAHWGQ